MGDRKSYGTKGIEGQRGGVTIRLRTRTRTSAVSRAVKSAPDVAVGNSTTSTGAEKRVSRCEDNKSESKDWMGVGLRMTGSDGMCAFSRSSVEEFGVFGVEWELHRPTRDLWFPRMHEWEKLTNPRQPRATLERRQRSSDMARWTRSRILKAQPFDGRTNGQAFPPSSFSVTVTRSFQEVEQPEIVTGTSKAILELRFSVMPNITSVYRGGLWRKRLSSRRIHHQINEMRRLDIARTYLYFLKFYPVQRNKCVVDEQITFSRSAPAVSLTRC